MARLGQASALVLSSVARGQVPRGEVPFRGSEQRLQVVAWEAPVKRRESRLLWVDGAGEAKEPTSNLSGLRVTCAEFSEVRAFHQVELSHLQSWNWG